jgi:ABC-2 type transport system permease protein
MGNKDKGNTMKRTRYGTFSLIISLVVIALVIVVNFLVNILESNLNLRADLSQYRIYSLSDESKKVLDNLDQTVEIYSLYTTSKEDKLIKELLNKYKAYSPKILYENVDPVLNPSFTQDFDPSGKGIPVGSVIVTDTIKQRYKVITRDQMYITDANSGQALGTMAEEYITSAVNYIKTGVVKSVKILTGHDETPPDSFLTILNTLSSRGYEMASFNAMTATTPLDPKNDTLLAVNPKSDLSDDEYGKVKDFLANGGKLFITLQNFNIDTSTGQVQAIKADFPNFSSLLLEYGLGVNKDLVIAGDPSHYYKQTTSLIPDIKQHAVTQPILQAGGNVVLTAASSINVPGTPSGDTKVTPLLTTDPKSYAKSIDDLKTLDKGPNDREGQYVVGAIAEKGDTRIALFTSDTFFTDADIGTAKNYDLAFNTLSYLGEQENSITIAPKRLKGEVLEIGSQFQKDILKILVIGVIPAAIIILGFFVWRKRRRL